MKRSEINSAIEYAKKALKESRFHLPPFAFWTVEDWQKKTNQEHKRIIINDLGWSVTDFGSKTFNKIGAVLFTIRNGNHSNSEEGTPYGEKVIVFKPGQYIPYHFHRLKTEDIINRDNSILWIQMYNADEESNIDYHSPINVYCDGIQKSFDPGQIVELNPGESITISPRLFHRWGAKEGNKFLISGEISTISDAKNDNRFEEGAIRFSEIIEDDKPIHLLSTEYPKTI